MLAAARSRVAVGGLTCLLTSSAVARKLVRLARSVEPERGSGEELVEVHFRRGPTHVRPSYAVTIRPAPGSPMHPPPRDCCRRAFLRAAFMTAGEVTIGSTGTHLEFRLVSEEAADQIAEVMGALEVRPRLRRRGPRWLVYVKGSEDVLRLLKAMGASQAVLRFENERILREMRGQANRAANSETSNLRRSVATGLRQAEAARRLSRTGLLEVQPQAIREVAQARISAPTATLSALASRLHLTKSAANARLRRMLALAGELGLVD